MKIDFSQPTSESLLCSVSWKSGSKSVLLFTSSNARYAAGMHATSAQCLHKMKEKEKDESKLIKRDFIYVKQNTVDE